MPDHFSPLSDLRILTLPGCNLQSLEQTWAMWFSKHLPNLNIQFTTDPQLEIEPSEIPTLAILRYPLDQFVAWFDERCAAQSALDQPKQWMNHAVSLPPTWLTFFKRWFLDQPSSACAIDYDLLYENPIQATQRLIDFLQAQGMVSASFSTQPEEGLPTPCLLYTSPSPRDA